MSAGANIIAATRHQISSNNINDKMKKKIKLVLLPGMGCVPVKESNFYGWLETKIRTDANLREKFTLDLRDFPDPHLCRQSIWLPFVRDELAADEHSILIGHSSGAVACARYAEKYKVKGICVCAGYDDDLGDATGRASGYFDTPWDYGKIQENTKFRVCFAGVKDHLVPIDVQRRFAKNLDAKCVEFPEGGHFFAPTFEELMREIEKALDETEDET
ncbi:unnamed protein product [Bathycoccus prasinos]